MNSNTACLEATDEWRFSVKKLVKKNQIIISALAVMIVVAGYLNFTGQEISTSGLVTSQQKEAAQKGKEDTASADQTQKPAKEEKKEESTSDQKTDQKANQKANQKAKKKGTVETSAEATEEEGGTDLSAEDEGGDGYTVNDDGEVVASEDNPGEAVMVSNSLGSDYFSSAKLTREQNRAKNKETLLEIINNKSVASKDKKAAVKEVAQITKNAEQENAAEMMLEAKGFQDAVVSISEGSADVVVNVEKLTDKEMAQIADIVKRKTDVSAENIVITPVNVEKE